MFPAVGAVRPTGTTVIIEDVAFPVDRLAAATLDLQTLLASTAIARRSSSATRSRATSTSSSPRTSAAPPRSSDIRRFMDAMCAMVVTKYDGSLKAEHGTGRNVAPFVELEWGAQAVATMRRIKALFDAEGCSTPASSSTPIRSPTSRT
jgi:D-lactate dehydrogenase